MLTVETGDITAGAESYVSAADATTYHENRLNTAWTGSDAVKEAALRKATAYIEGRYGRRWKGQRVAVGQPLSWPRNYVLQYEEESFIGYAQTPVYINSNVIPQCLKDAVCEAALRALAGDLAPDVERGGQVKREKTGPLETEYFSGAPALPSYPVIDQLLSSLLKPVSVDAVRG